MVQFVLSRPSGKIQYNPLFFRQFSGKIQAKFTVRFVLGPILNGIKSSSLLRKFLLKIVEQNFQNGNSEPIITVQDYTEYLFPEDNFWKEIRDVLLIAIYQRLHENAVKVEGMEIDNEFEDDED